MARTLGRLPDGTRLSDHVTLGAMTATIPAALIDPVLADTGWQSHPKGLSGGRKVSGSTAASGNITQGKHYESEDD